MNLLVFRYRPREGLTPDWCIVYTGSFRAFCSVVRSANSNKVPLWIPSYDVIRAKRNDVIKITRLVFPGYIFVNGKDNLVSLDEDRKDLFRVLPDAEYPYFLTVDDIGHIDRFIDDMAKETLLQNSFNKGESVQLLTGPFKNLIGVIDGVSGTNITLSLKVFARFVHVNTKFYNIKKV